MLDNIQETDARYYDLHGLFTFKVSGRGDSVGEGLDRELCRFRIKSGKPDLSIEFGSFPSDDWVPTGFSIDKNLFYDRALSATTVLWKTSSVIKKRDVRYILLGDMKKPNDNVSVYIPSTIISRRRKPKFWRNIPQELLKKNWAKAALLGLRRESFYSFEEVDNATNEVLMLIIQPYLYYRLPTRGYSFVHGSAVSTADGSGAIFFGTSNVGKTRVALEMARQGMDFLGDDLAIVGPQGQGFSYPKRVRIEPQDTLIYPKLMALIRSSMDGRQRFVFDATRKFSKGKAIGVNVRLPITDLLPNTKVRDSFRLRTLIHVKRVIGSEPFVQELDHDSCVNLLTSELFWQFSTGGKQEYVSCASYVNGKFLEEEVNHHARVVEIISKAVDGAKCLELQLPTQFESEEVGKMINRVVSL